MSSSLTRSAAECVCTPRIIYSGHAWCPGHYLSTYILPPLKSMHRICPFSWYYTYSIHLHQLAVDFYWCNTHHTQKSKHTSYFKICHGSNRPSIFNQTYSMVSTHTCTMTRSACADYTLKSTVPRYYFISDMLLPYFLKLRVHVTSRKLRIWYKEHNHNMEYNWDE